MKSGAKHALCLFLVALMALSVLASCGNFKKETTDTVAKTEEETLSIDSNVPSSLTYNGAEVSMMIHTGMQDEFIAEDSTGAIFSQAVFERNAQTEKRRNVTITYSIKEAATSGAYQNLIRTSITSGTDACDIITGNAYYTAALASEGLFLDLNSEASGKNYLDTTADWFNQSFVTETAYKNKLYFLVGDLNISAVDRTPLIFYNENLMKTWGLTDDIYGVVSDGKWTIEYLQNIVKNIYSDVDGMGEKDSGDLYGLVFNGGSMAIDGMISAVGIRVTTTSDDGEVSIAWADQTGYEGFADLYELMYSSDGVYTGFYAQGNYYGTATSYFSEQSFYEEHAVFATGMLMASKMFSTVQGLNYGLLPLPKYSEEQEYRTTPQDGYTIISVPYNLENRTEIVTATLETLYEDSYIVIRPVYYDTMYKVRYTSSEKTATLFNTIINSISYDFGMFYSHSINDPTHLLRNRLTGEGTMTAGSNMQYVVIMNSTTVAGALQTLLDKFDLLS